MDINIINTICFIIIALCMIVRTFAGGVWGRRP